MSLVLLQNYTAVRNTGLSVPFGASGGVAPYTYTVLPGGAGGTIDPGTGVYTSPQVTGVDQIRVTDSSSPALVATGSIAVCLPIELVCDIISNQLGLAADQVYLYQQKFTIPPDSRLYISVGVRSQKVFGNRPSYEGGSSSLVASQSVNVQWILSVDLLSRSTLPLTSTDLLYMALSSPYAEAQMNLNSFAIGPIPNSVVNISGIDGPAIPYHFQLSLSLTYAAVNSVSVPFFDSFSGPQITTEP